MGLSCTDLFSSHQKQNVATKYY